jgi:hypothetical protein
MSGNYLSLLTLERCNFLCRRNSEASATGRGWVIMQISPNLSIRVVQLFSTWETPDVHWLRGNLLLRLCWLGKLLGGNANNAYLLSCWYNVWK